jgi:hypothetical protein
VLLGVLVAGAVAFGRWQVRGKPPAPAPPIAAVQPPVAVQPPPPPSPPPVEPVSAPVQTASATLEPAPEPAEAPPAAAEPPATATPRQNRRAEFEPEAIAIRRVQPKKHLIDRQDRKMLDLLERKQDGTAPRPVEPLAVGAAEGLDHGTVARTVDAQQGAFSACVSRSLKGGAPAPGRATLLVSVDPGGTVDAAWIAEAEVDRTPLGRCLTTAARRMVFPSFDGDPMEVSVPMVLEGR